MQFVDEQDDLAFGLPDLVHDGLEAFFELASELGACHQRAHVEREHAPVSQLPRRVAGHDALRQALGDCRLADSRSTDQYRVVLRAADERLHHARDLRLASDYRIELSGRRQFGQVYAEPVERTVAALRPLVRYAVTPTHRMERLVHPLGVHSVLLENLGQRPLLLLCERDEQVLRADEVVPQAVRLGLCPAQRRLCSRGHEDLRRLLR